MFIFKKLNLLLSAAFCALLLTSLGAMAQPTTEAPAVSAPTPTPSNVEQNLAAILSAIKESDRELAEVEKQIGQEKNGSRLERLNDRLHELEQRREKLQQNFVAIASGVDPQALEEKGEDHVDLMQDLRDLLRPLIREAQQLTARPREDDRLRSEVARYSEQLELINQAITATKQTKKTVSDPALKSYLKNSKADWENRKQQVQTQLEISREALERRNRERKTLSQSLNDLFNLFFRSRGRNFLLALLAAVGFSFLIGRLRTWAVPDADQMKMGIPFSQRLANVIFSLLSFVGSGLVFMFVLYLFGDWVLLILAVLLILGAIWTSKHALPKFWNQMTLLLNVGAVREGERVMINGIPWKVQTLNFYSELINPQLTGGLMRLPIRDLDSLRSRTSEPGESWFPTTVGDWLLLGDGTLGRVAQQTPEHVELTVPGGSPRFFTTAEFIAKTPTVLSHGFRVETIFGIGYEHQAQATLEIPKLIKQGVTDALNARGLKPHLKHVTVEFKRAAASSLDYEIEVDFAGAAAHEYEMILHLLQEICVDLCNRHGWNIPFQQVTVHMSKL